MLAGSVTVTAYLVSGLTTGMMSNSCGPRCRTPSGMPSALYMRSARFTCPERNRHGEESSQAPARPVMAFVPPGPVVSMATPRPFVTLA